MTPLDRPIFIVGCPRSGTTLVQCILSASSGAFSLPETHFFCSILPTLGAAPETVLGRAGVRQARSAIELEAEITLGDAFWRQLDARDSMTGLDLFCAIVDHYQPAVDLRAIEKTPRHVLVLDTLATAFSDAVFVNVVRDPIDVASSLLGVPFETSRSVLSHAQRWTESIHAARTFERVHPRCIMTVVYERLVRDPEPMVRDLSAFAGLAYEPGMLEEFGREATRNVGRGEAWKRDISSGVIMNRQGVWRTRMTPGQAWLVASATSKLRSEFGYTERPRATPSSIARALLGEARVRFREARASTGVVGAARYAGSVLKTLSAA